MTDPQVTEILAEMTHVRDILRIKEQELTEIRVLTHKLLGAYIGALKAGGAVLATNREANPIIAEAQERLGLLS